MPTLADLRAKIPDELDGLDDQRAIEYVQEAYYPDRPLAEVQKALGYTPAAPRPTGGQFSSGFSRSFAEVPGMVAGVGAFAADAVGAEGVRDSLSAYAAKKNQEVGATHANDASSLSDAWDGKVPWTDWLANSAGYVAGQALQSIATGGVGMLAGKAVAWKGARYLAEVAAAKAIAEGATEKVAMQAAAAAVKAASGRAAVAGAATGAFAHNEVMELGSIYTDAVEEAAKHGKTLSGDDLARIFGAASLAAGVDTAGEALLVRGALRGSSSSGGLAKRVATEVPKAAAREAGTEGIQTVLEQYGAAKPYDTREIIDSMGVGAVGGGLGGAASARQGRYSKTVEDPSDPLDPHTPPEDKEAAAKARASILTATSVDEAIDAFNASRLPIRPTSRGIDGDAALARLRAAADLPAPGATMDPETGELIAAPSFKQRHEALVAQLEDTRTRQHIRETLGADALNDALYYSSAADNPNLPGATSDKMVAQAEAIIARAAAAPVPGAPIADASATPGNMIESAPTPDASNTGKPPPIMGTPGAENGTAAGAARVPPGNGIGGVTPAAAPLEGMAPPRRGNFETEQAVLDHLKRQRSMAQGRTPAAVPKPFPDGSWGFTTDKKEVEAAGVQSLKDRAAAMAQGGPAGNVPRGTEPLPEPMEGDNGMQAVFTHSTTKPGSVHVTLFDTDSGQAVGTKIVTGVARAKFEAEKLLGKRESTEKWMEPRANLAKAGVELVPTAGKLDAAATAVLNRRQEEENAAADELYATQEAERAKQNTRGDPAPQAPAASPETAKAPAAVAPKPPKAVAPAPQDREKRVEAQHAANREAVKGFKVGDILRRKDDGHVYGRITEIDTELGRVEVEGSSIPAASMVEVAPEGTPIPREERQKAIDAGNYIEEDEGDEPPLHRFIISTPAGNVQVNLKTGMGVHGVAGELYGDSISETGYRSMMGLSPVSSWKKDPRAYAQKLVEQAQAEEAKSTKERAAEKVRTEKHRANYKMAERWASMKHADRVAAAVKAGVANDPGDYTQAGKPWDQLKPSERTKIAAVLDGTPPKSLKERATALKEKNKAKAAEELPEGLVEIPADESAFAAAMRQVDGEDERAAAMFGEQPETVTLPRDPKGSEFLSPEKAAAKVAEWKAAAAEQGKKFAGKNGNRTVISLFDVTGQLAQPWADAGYQVVTYDLQTGTDINDFNAENLLEQHGNDNVWAILAQPPCTDFANSGAQWWAKKDEDGRTEASNELVRQVLRTVELFRPPVWTMENPSGRMAKLNKLPKPTLSFDPWHYGDPYTKRTHLWGRFDPDLPRAFVEPTEGSKMHRMSSNAKYERSVTPEGFSYAFFMANNAESMAPAQRLAQEYAGVDSTLFDAAVVAGHSEQDIKNAIDDSYYENDLEYVRDELTRLGTTPGGKLAAAIEKVEPGEKGLQRQRADKRVKKYLQSKRPSEGDDAESFKQQVIDYRTQATMAYNEAVDDRADQDILDVLRTEATWATDKMRELAPESLKKLEDAFKNSDRYDPYDTPEKRERAARAKADPEGYLRDQIPEVLSTFGGKLSVERLTGNLGDPNDTGRLMDETLALRVMNKLVAEGVLKKTGTGSVELAPVKEIVQRDGTKARARARQRMALDPDNDTMLQALAKLGGIKRSVVAKEFGLKPEELKHTVTVGGLKGFPFRATGGMELDQAIEALTESGYFRGIADEDVRSTFEAAIFDEIAGNARRTPEGTIKHAQLQFTDAELDREARLEADAGVTHDEAESITEADVEAIDSAGADDDPVAAMRAMGYTDKEIADDLERESRQSSGAEDPEAGPGQAAGAGDDDGGAPRPAPAQRRQAQAGQALDVLALDEAAIEALTGTNVEIPVQVGDTGRTATISMDAAAAVRDLQTRAKAARELRECL